MPQQMDEHYASALRAALIEHVAAAPQGRHRRPWRLLIGAGAGALVLGGGVAMAAEWLTPPGADVVTHATSEVTVTRTGSATVELGPAPKDATNIMMKFTCLSAGRFTLPDGSWTRCSEADAKSGTSVVTAKLPLAAGQNGLVITAGADAKWTLSASYAHVTVGDWGVNEDGQTYGRINDNGIPDLVAVEGNNGHWGYAKSSDLMPTPSNPADALAHAGSGPHDIPVYKEDGKTVIDSYTVQGP